MDTLASYDELPYDSLALPETQPDVIAAMAHLHGFDAPDPRRARILELGCAQGGNLIPLAWRWPDCECVGIELARVQAAAGADFVARLGLPNVRILHGDLAALPTDLGAFDYIIAHGVYSWVSPAVQQALLDACRRHLSPRGLAYVSFNVAAGWAPLAPLRAALHAHTEAALPAPARHRQALGVLDRLAAEASDPALRKEIAWLGSASPSYFFHEYLAEFNEPLAFSEFAARLDAHALRYVGEMGPLHAVVELEDAWGLSPEGMAGRWLDAEATLDDTQGIRFRRALIARADAPCAQPAAAARLDALAFYADLASDEEIDLEAPGEQVFVNAAGNRFPLTEPAMKAAAMVLAMAYPRALSFAELAAAVGGLLRGCGVAGTVDADVLRGPLFALVLAHGVVPTVWADAAAVEPGTRPCAHALARLQAATPGWTVSGVRHVALDLDVPARRLLGLLDGGLDVDALVASMQAMLAQSGVEIPAARIDALTRQQLWRFARQGLLAPCAA
jgi:SAM-dependent methyltransferase